MKDLEGELDDLKAESTNIDVQKALTPDKTLKKRLDASKDKMLARIAEKEKEIIDAKNDIKELKKAKEQTGKAIEIAE